MVATITLLSGLVKIVERISNANTTFGANFRKTDDRFDDPRGRYCAP
jgi:hypothetical protein